MSSHLSMYFSSPSQIVIIRLKKMLSCPQLRICDPMCIMIKWVFQDFSYREFSFFELLADGLGWWLGLLPLSRFPISYDSQNGIVLLSVSSSLLLLFVLFLLHNRAICGTVLFVAITVCLLFFNFVCLFFFSFGFFSDHWLLSFAFSFFFLLLLKLLFLASSQFYCGFRFLFIRWWLYLGQIFCLWTLHIKLQIL